MVINRSEYGIKWLHYKDTKAIKKKKAVSRRSIRKIKKNSLPANSSSSVLTLRLPSIAFLRAVKRGGREKENRFRDFEGCVYVHLFLCGIVAKSAASNHCGPRVKKRGHPPQQEENQNEMFTVLRISCNSCMAYFLHVCPQ